VLEALLEHERATGGSAAWNNLGLNQATGEILAEFTRHPSRDCQGKKKHPGPKTGVQPMSQDR
jgi:hypothetical protein